MWVLQRKKTKEYLYISGNTYKLGELNKCSTYLSKSGATQSLTKHKSMFYLKMVHGLTTLDFDVVEATLTLK